MLAVPGPLPADDATWAYEFKWDGIRALCRVLDGVLTVRSRTGRDITAGYPELAPLGALVPSDTILDTEIVALDEASRPSFAALQRRMHVVDAGAVARLVVEVPATALCFDLLRLGGVDLTGWSYDRRRAALDELALAGGAWQTPPSYPGDGAVIAAASRSAGLEGVVAKRRASTYEPGRRSPSWVKVKNIRTQDVVVGGWKAGAGRRTDRIGSLLLGVHESAGLVYVGNVGTGFTTAALGALQAQLRPFTRPRSPFVSVPAAKARDVTWLAPELVGEVAFTEWTPDGHLRHPSWRGLRADRQAVEVVREQQ